MEVPDDTGHGVLSSSICIGMFFEGLMIIQTLDLLEFEVAYSATRFSQVYTISEP